MCTVANDTVSLIIAVTMLNYYQHVYHSSGSRLRLPSLVLGSPAHWTWRASWGRSKTNTQNNYRFLTLRLQCVCCSTLSICFTRLNLTIETAHFESHLQKKRLPSQTAATLERPDDVTNRRHCTRSIILSNCAIRYWTLQQTIPSCPHAPHSTHLAI